MIYRCQSGYTLRKIEHTYYLLPYGQQVADQKKGLSLNETSAFLWNLLHYAGEASPQQLATMLAEAYHLSEDNLPTVLQDVHAFLQQLCHLGMITELLQPSSLQSSFSVRIAGILMDLYDPSELLDDSFADFVVSSCSQKADQRLEFLSTPPDSHSYGQVLLQNSEMTIFRNPDRYIVLFPQMPAIHEVHMTPDGSYVRFYCVPVHTADSSADLFHAIRLFFLFYAQKKGLFALHSASILYRRKAWLFSGHSGMGKSTHTALWHELFQTPYLNGDLNLLGIQNGQLLVYGIPWCGTSGLFTAKVFPLGGIVLLAQRPDLDLIEPLSPQEKILRVMQRMISPSWTETQLSENLSFAGRIARQVPVLHLSCTRNPSAAHTMKKEIDRLEELS